MEFIPYLDLKQHAEETVVVDSYHPSAAYTLSHWRGLDLSPELRADTSTEICLKAIAQNHPALNCTYVTNNHFDIDGFCGIWAMQTPEKALEYRETLSRLALIGDFREAAPLNEASLRAIKLACWLNKLETELFYAPFDAGLFEEKEARLCVPKFDYFLPRFGEALENPEIVREHWEKEFEEIVKGISTLSAQNITLLEEERLQIISLPEASHYYVHFAWSYPADMVLSILPGNRYELEYKYTTWVDTARSAFPRLNMQALAKELNALEESTHTWTYETVTDTGPILRLDGKELSKKERYDHPKNRPIYASSIPEERFVEIVKSFYRRYLKDLPQKGAWEWKEIKSINQALSL